MEVHDNLIAEALAAVLSVEEEPAPPRPFELVTGAEQPLFTPGENVECFVDGSWSGAQPLGFYAPPGSVVRPDVSDKSMCPKDPDFLPETGPDDYYQERVLHYAVMGTDEYIYFGPWGGFVCELQRSAPANLTAV